MERLIRDLKFALRTMRTSQTYSIIAILTLTLGIGITTAMFTLVNSVLLKPLPFPKSEELVYVSVVSKKQDSSEQSLNIEFVEEIQRVNSPLQEIAYFAYDQVTLAKEDLQLPFTTLITSPNYLSMFGVSPIIGRWYDESDVGAQSIVISYDLWQNEFNGSPDILSQDIKIDNRDFKILGVMPPGYSNSGYTSVDFWLPINKLDRPIRVVARLKGGIQKPQAIRLSTAIQRIVNRQSDESNEPWEIKYTSALDSIVGESKSSLYLLMASVFAVFLIAVLNVVNLTFAQFANRTQELTIRASVGATRQRLIRQLLTESALLCGIGGICGLLFAAWSLEWITLLMGGKLPRLHEIGIDNLTLIAVLGLISFSTVLTTLIPAYSIINPHKMAEALKYSGRKVTGDVKSQKIRRLLVSSEVSVAVVLLICAGLLMRSYINLANQDTGFSSENIVTGHIWLPDNFVPNPNRSSYWLSLVEQLKKNQHISAVAGTSTMPMSRTGIDYPVNYSYPGAPAVPRGEEPSASVRSITPDYFSMLEIPIFDGREFDFRDTSDSPRVVIVNKYLADKTWPNQSIIGNKLLLPDWMGGEHTVIGVVGNVKHRGLNAEISAEFFLPVTQYNLPGMTYLVKTSENNFGAVKNEMARIAILAESTAPMILIETLERLTNDSIANERLMLIVLSMFAGVALVLAGIGVYGISDNMVSQRTKEIGIRMAIGARPVVIRKWIVFDAAIPVLTGAIFGVIIAFIVGNFMASVLYGVSSFDPIVFASVPVVLFIVGVLATWLPASRATRMHPQYALYCE